MRNRGCGCRGKALNGGSEWGRRVLIALKMCRAGNWDRGCRDHCPEWGVGIGKAGTDQRGNVLSEVPQARYTKHAVARRMMNAVVGMVSTECDAWMDRRCVEAKGRAAAQCPECWVRATSNTVRGQNGAVDSRVTCAFRAPEP